MMDFYGLDPEWWRALFYTALAMGGGFLGHLMRNMEDESGKIRWRHAFIQAAASGFTGFLMLMACSALEVGDLWTGVIVGVFGWFGANATIVVLEKLVYRKLGLEEDKDDPSTR